MKKLALTFALILVSLAAAHADDYQATSGTSIFDATTQATIPADPENKDYQIYQAWVAAGNTAAPYTAPTATPAQRAATAIGLGIAITSTATPTLNGTYALDQASQNNLNAAINYLQLNGTFFGGSVAVWVDSTGTEHMFPSLDEFKAFATAYANYAASITLFSVSNGAAGSIPTSNAVTIP